MSETEVQRPDKRRRRRIRPGTESATHQSAVSGGMPGGAYAPLAGPQLEQIKDAVLRILEHTGLMDATEVARDRVLAAGGWLDDDARLRMPRALTEAALAGLRRRYTLHGQKPGLELDLSGANVHMGSGGASPQVVDLETGHYRDATLKDLYDAARLVDSLEHIHFFSRSLVARDMSDALALDINTAYASLAGTAKHVCVSISEPAHVETIAEMCFEIAGSREAFLERPFLSLNNNHVIPPLRFYPEAAGVLEEAARIGIPVHCNATSQAGAACPVTQAGAIAQTVAESLAGMIVAWLVNPDSCTIMGVKPMITDLRTGAMTGGGGEQAMLMAACTQVARYLDLPNCSIAGATDSKIADAQSGYEKALSVTLAAQAGSNLITQAAGMQASLLGCALESYMIDNDMLGAILRTLAPFDVDEAALATDLIDEVVRGEGHFLGSRQTLERMQSDFVYPAIADRKTPQEWEDAGEQDIRTVARERTRQLLARHYPTHISGDTDKRLRDRFDIRLPREYMKP